ncbi:hypothetical protein FRC17_008226 [Serendipita sp. 399]|nr:hypothetical protein FRC17_008226 [Serendipita sp. 399]
MSRQSKNPVNSSMPPMIAYPQHQHQQQFTVTIMQPMPGTVGPVTVMPVHTGTMVVNAAPVQFPTSPQPHSGNSGRNTRASSKQQQTPQPPVVPHQHHSHPHHPRQRSNSTPTAPPNMQAIAYPPYLQKQPKRADSPVQSSGSKGKGNKPIYFYDKSDPHYGFTNFSPHTVNYLGKRYPTSEHAFQAHKASRQD